FFLRLLSCLSGEGVHRDLRSFPTRRSSELAIRSGISAATTGVLFRNMLMNAESSSVARNASCGRSAHIVASDREIGCSAPVVSRSEEHTSELQSRENLVCRLLLEKKKRLEH